MQGVVERGAQEFTPAAAIGLPPAPAPVLLGALPGTCKDNQASSQPFMSAILKLDLHEGTKISAKSLERGIASLRSLGMLLAG